MSFDHYVSLGRSGLLVSPFSLGTMTFGTEWGWGADEAASRAVFDRYIAAGGNFIDTADIYTNGHSEEMLATFIGEGKLRDRVVLATKFTFNPQPGNPNSGGNGRKNVYRAIEASLKRLKTDYIDLYWLHAWDTITPVEEVVSALDSLVREGKIRYYGFSDTPAWYAARARTLAEKEGKAPLIALQLEYSLVERNIEREHIPLAQEVGMAVLPWSPLASGLLTGKYTREGNSGKGEGRLEITKNDANPVFRRFSERNWGVVDALLGVAKKLGKSPAQVALNWTATQPGITSTIIGATSVKQLEANIASLDFAIPGDLRARLDEAGAIDPIHPYLFFSGHIAGMVSGGASVRAWTPARATGAPPEQPAASAKAHATGE